jgi:cleavage and polyadenylation specificity factor subunit 1
MLVFRVRFRILDLTSVHGIIPGGGYFVEKLPMGVTVRQVQFIDNPAICGSRPLYAMLVSREFEDDLSPLNDDGLAGDERERLAEEKESAVIKRQVEADLGGFDIEQEWVEAIERENCFKVDTDFGGAPPISKSAYSIWVVDAASGWVVVDSYELEEFEHGLTMQVMALSEVSTRETHVHTLHVGIPLTSLSYKVYGGARKQHHGHSR